MNRPRPQRHDGIGRDVAVIAAIAAVWIGAWGLLTVAAAVAGGQPVASPQSFIDPALVTRRSAHVHGFAWWVLVDPRRPVAPVVFWFVLFAGVTCLIAVTVAAVRLRPWRRLPLSRRSVPRRTTRWARAHDLRGLRVRRSAEGRFCLGAHGRMLVVTEPETSVLVVGPTRSGKTSAVVVPNLLDWRGPAVVTSTKAELVTITAGARQRVGPVYVYDPTGDAATQAPSVTWSPLSGCDDLDRAWRCAAWLCAGLQAGGGRGDNDWTHWAESGKLLVAPLLHAAACTGRSILDVQQWVHGFDLTTPAALLEEHMYAGSTDAERALSMLQSVDQRPEKERGTVFSTVMRLFSPFNERAVAQSAESSRLDPLRLLNGNGTLYLCAARQSPERVAGLFVGLLMTVVTAAYEQADRMPGGRLRPELGLFLDELANIVPVEELPSLASQGAGRGILLLSIVQDISQLRARYGADRTHSLLNNHVCKLVLPGVADPETADLVARMSGQQHITEEQLSRSQGTTSRTYQVRAEPIVTADGVRQLSEGSALMLYRGRPPALLRLRSWYADRALAALTRIPYLRGADQVTRLRSARPPAGRKHLVRKAVQRGGGDASDADRPDLVDQRRQ